METKTCQNCKNEFTIQPEDFDFYKKMDVPPPTWCPRCRDIRRSAWREERTLYKDTCKLCGKGTLSIHPPGSPFTVYCRDCWISDKWDPMDYGRDYDFSKPFFSQYRELMEVVPRPALTGNNLVNCEYAHACLNCKNCYLTYWAYFTEDSQYSFGPLLARYLYDTYIVDKSDHVYEAIHSSRLYRARFAYFSDECLEGFLLYDCVGCSDCFGCVNVRKQKYCVWNEQLTKEAYAEQMAHWDLGSYKRLEEAKVKFRELYLAMPRRYAHVLNSVNVSGDIIQDTKNCQTCFSALDGVQNCKYIYFAGLNLKDSYDLSRAGDLAEFLYEDVALTRGHHCYFSAGGTGSSYTHYTDWAKDSSDLFGCIAMKNKKYCVFNRQYSKEQYGGLVEKIRKHMDEMPYTDKRGRIYKYGEFFPPELSAYAYNDSLAFTWYPKTKAEVIAEGLRWQDPPEREYAITKPPEELPDHINDAGDSILEETIGCLHKGECNEKCTTAFRLTPQELAFYRDMKIALPRLCSNCRYAQRLLWRNGFDIWRRKCMCGGRRSASREAQIVYTNTAEHFHKNDLCPNEFDTTFAPNKPEIIYCGDCYRAEFL